MAENQIGVTLFLVAVLAAVCAMGVQGCDLSQAIKVSVPQGIQGAVNVPAKVTLADAQDVYEDFRAWSSRQVDSFSESIESGWRWHGFFQGALRIGLAEAKAVGMGGFPIGGLLLSLITGAAGLAMTRPGTAAKIAAEKMASHNKGLEEGRKAVDNREPPPVTGTGGTSGG